MAEVTDLFAINLSDFWMSWDSMSKLGIADNCGSGMHARTIVAFPTTDTFAESNYNPNQWQGLLGVGPFGCPVSIVWYIERYVYVLNTKQ